MATCNPQTLLDSAQCFTCLTPGEFYPVKLALLCQILSEGAGNPTTACNVQALLDEAKCFTCLEDGFWPYLELAIICRIAEATGGGGGGTPSAPSSFFLSEFSENGSIGMTWQESGSPDTIDIYRQVNGGGFALLFSVPGGNLNFTDTTVYVGGDLIEYKLQAIKSGNPSAFTATKGVLNGGNDAAVVGAISYPTVEIILSTYTVNLSVTVTSIDFPILLHADRPIGAATLDLGSLALVSFSAPQLLRCGNLIGTGLSGAFVSLNLNSLSRVRGDFNFAGAGTFLANLSLPALTQVDQVFDFQGNALVTFSAPLLATVGANFTLANNTGLTSVNLASLGSVGTNLTFDGCSSLTALSLPALTTVPLEFSFTGATACVTISVPNLTDTGYGFVISGASACTSLVTTSLVTVGMNVAAPLPSLHLSGFNSTLTFSFPALTDVGGQCEVLNSSGVTQINFASLAHVGQVTGGDDFVILDCDALTTLTTPALIDIAQSFDVENCAVLTAISAPSLTGFGEDCFTSDNPACTSVSFPVLTTIAGGNINAKNNTVMTSWSAPNLNYNDGVQVEWNNGALTSANVNQILARLVAAAPTTDLIDLSGGTNGAPTGQGIIDKAALALAGNTVTTN